MATETPIWPELILVDEISTKTRLIVGQFQSTIYPLSTCCRVKAVKAHDRLFKDHWQCVHCKNYLGQYHGEALAVSDFESGPEGPSMVISAVSKWIGVPREDINLTIEGVVYPRPRVYRVRKVTGSTGPR